MERTQNTNNNNGVSDDGRENFPINQVNSSPLPSNNNHVVVNPSSTSLSTQNRPVFYSNMSENHHNSGLGVPEHHPQNNNPVNSVSENPHTSRFSRPEFHPQNNNRFNYKSETPYVSPLGLPEYYHQDNNFSTYSSENHHNPYLYTLEDHTLANQNSLSSMMEGMDIQCSSSHASSSYQPSLHRHPANLLRNEVMLPSSARALSNNNVSCHRSSPRRNNYASFNYVDRFSPSSEHIMRGYMKLEAIRVTEKQERCLSLHRKLKMSLSKTRFDDIFSEIMENIGDLMVDRYGHELVIDLLIDCDARQTSTIVKGLVERDLLISICLNEHGCKVVQTLFKQLRILKQTNEMRMICDVLSPITMVLINHYNGCHVIKKCLEVFHFEDNWKVAEEIGSHARELAVDKKGIIVLNACIQFAHEELRERIVRAFDGKMVSYSKHPYGNYVVQCILKTKDSRAIARVLVQLKGNFVSMAMNKFASPVVENCLRFSTQEQVGSIIIELANGPHFKYMIHDEFGNYVVQSALKIAEGPHLNYLLNRVMEYKSCLETNHFGKRVLKTAVRVLNNYYHRRDVFP